MVHDAIVHIANEQPIMADLLALPLSSDTNLICTNVRTMNGKKPVFVGDGDSTFAFPMIHIRFIEIPRAQMEVSQAEAAASRPVPAVGHPLDAADAEYPEPPLSRLGWVTGGGELQPESGLVPVDASDPETAEVPAEEELWPEDVRRKADLAGLDGDLLKRIRDV
ncbi:MAG TPA: hypothetical protein VF337_11175 [Candidatus Limnocylindrales bacterium]